MKIVVNDINYELFKENKNGFDKEEFLNRYTDYFEDFDYILGDYSYGKLRLKGFCDKKNKRYKKINDIALIDDYIENHCAYGCSWFVVKKI